MQSRKTLRIFNQVFLTLPVKTAPQSTYINTLYLAILLSFVLNISFGQKYEYMSFYQVKAGMEDKAKIDFDWPSKPDSAKALNTLKLRSPLEAIQKMEGIGFELVTLNEYSPGNLVIIVSGYMRRKKR